MSTELSKAYDPTDVEPRWYASWVQAGLFSAVDTGDPSNAFSIAIPPPNVTGSLHMGHALFCTIQDTLVRVARMQGRNTLWQPGVDHAGIATEVVVSRLLAREGTSRQEVGRAGFLDRVWQWKEQSGGRITEQLRKLGASPAWERERFTMDEQCSRAVREAFVRLFEEGLIYRGERLVNWSVAAQTVISDLEVEREENANGELYSFAYLFADGSGEIVVATTRPETILGDTAVAVHPDDPRYQLAIGKLLQCPFSDRQIPVIADAVLVDPTFGTGAVKVTPAHDFNDYETGKRHSLEFINILNLDGTVNETGGEFAGQDRFVARKAIKRALDAKGLSRGSKNHLLAIAREARTGDILEPMMLPQWYVKAGPLAGPALEAVRSGRTTIEPVEWVKTYEHWLTNIQDWCISRQLWWGHQIPAWYCSACHEVTVSRATPTECVHCKHSELTQDTDVLDTWFSSALWPFSTLGWPEKTKALETFYPTTVMETGYDILFFWVARMMMFGLHFMGEVPFKRVLLHGMVCDERGEKMSKVKGNVIDPLHMVFGATLDEIVANASGGAPREEAIAKFRKAYPSFADRGEGFDAFGADAVRFYLATNPPQAKRINLQLRQVERAKNFANKMWNATRFTLPMLEPLFVEGANTSLPPRDEWTAADRWILARLALTVNEVHSGLDGFRLDECTTSLRRFFWDELCDWYLELCKPVFASEDEAAKDRTRRVLIACLETSFRLLHPFMPFVTEELWQKLPEQARAKRSDGANASHLAVAAFPSVSEFARDELGETILELVQGAIVAVRNIRGELGIKPRDPLRLTLRTDNAESRALLSAHERQIRALTNASEFTLEGSGPKPKGVGYSVVSDVEVIVPLEGLIDPNTEIARLEKELIRTQKDHEKVSKQLSNESFVARANPEAVQTARNDLASHTAKISKLTDALVVLRLAVS
ncbi:MAG: valine--tRNA ligase [Deltaproteobacteria bacterium]|nr:valine--tRNA ligase [Deltaproteobacteria bacterium]